jgi:hypothetical protein
VDDPVPTETACALFVFLNRQCEFSPSDSNMDLRDAAAELTRLRDSSTARKPETVEEEILLVVRAMLNVRTKDDGAVMHIYLEGGT